MITPSSYIGGFTALIVVDQVCIVYSNTCAQEVEFYADLTGWPSYNILGLAPVDTATAPNLVSMLYEQGVIDEAMVTLNFNPVQNVTSPIESTIIFGSAQVADLVVGEWYEHELHAKTDSYFSKVMLALNATNFTYGDETQLAQEPFDLLLSTTLSNFMQLGKNASELYQSWASEMQKIPGI